MERCVGRQTDRQTDEIGFIRFCMVPWWLSIGRRAKDAQSKKLDAAEKATTETLEMLV